MLVYLVSVNLICPFQMLPRYGSGFMKLVIVLNSARCDPIMSYAPIELVQRQGMVANTPAELVDKDLGDTCVSVAKV